MQTPAIHNIAYKELFGKHTLLHRGNNVFHMHMIGGLLLILQCKCTGCIAGYLADVTTDIEIIPRSWNVRCVA